MYNYADDKAILLRRSKSVDEELKGHAVCDTSDQW